MELRYRLNKEDIEESLLCVDWKKEGIWKHMNVTLLTIIDILCIWRYIVNPENVFVLFIAFFALILLFGVTYFSVIHRKYKADKMSRKKGIYKVKISKEDIGCIFESENVYTIKKNRDIYCIPKKEMNTESKKMIKELIFEHRDKFIEVKTRR